MAVSLNIEKAIEFYYSKLELTTKDIAALFSCSEPAALVRKKVVMAESVKRDPRPLVFEAKNVNTEFAFEQWGLDIKEMEEKYKKLQKFKKLRGADVA